MMDMGRPKGRFSDLPPHMTARESGGKVHYYHQANGKKTPLGTDKAEALRKWANLEAGGTVLLFPAVVRMYREAQWAGFSASTQEHYGIALRNLESYLRRYRLEQVEPRHVKNYLRKRSKKGAALFEKRVLSAVFNWAREEGLTSAPNPCQGVTFSKAERKTYQLGARKVYVTEDMFQAVYGRAGELVRDMMDLALVTGQRPSDLLKARRSDIVDGVLWIDQQKTGERVGIKVQGALKEVLERIFVRLRPVQSVYIVADQRGQRVTYGALNRRWREARGADKWQFRDLRAKTASDAPDLKTAQRLLGHANETTTAAVYRRAKGAIVEPLERKI